MVSPFPLGPFLVDEPVGRGGMGQVWVGEHRDTGVPVAVKVLHPAAVRDERSLESFRNEVRAIAALDHPGVVWVFDVGEVDRDAAVATNGQIVHGSPYLAMEYASGGTLSKWVPRSWDAVLTMLLDVLEGLAHAHSRNVIHRDMKPGNVLHCTASDVRPGWKLTDFGIAAALEETIEHSIRRGIVGTLSYMSPEQIRSSWRDFGPWTDLYALGCIVYRVVGAQRPFSESKGPALMVAHLTQTPVPLQPKVEVPEGFHEWVERLMEKEPRDRFSSAAEAAAALRSLGAPVPTPDDLSPVALDTLPTLEETTVEDPTEVVKVSPAQAELMTSGLPTDWRRFEAPWPPPRLVDAGLGLFGLRTLPMAGRERERDALWSALLEVARSGRARAVVVRGASGVGKTRLVRWIGETAHARGGVTFLMGQARPDDSPEEAILRPLRAALHTVRLSDEQRLTRLAAALGSSKPDVVRALSALLSPDGEAHGMRVEGDSRYGVVRMALELIARGRPLVLGLDDVHASLDALTFVFRLLEAQEIRSVPVLVLLSARSEVVSAAPTVEAELEALVRRDDVEELHLEPLPREDHGRLVQGMLPLERTLAARLEERTAGNPLHAVQLVRDWVATERLSRGPAGFELDGELSGTAPLSEVWDEHVERLVDGLPEAATILIEQAAVLGHEVSDEDWQRVSDDPKGRTPPGDEVPVKPQRETWRAELRRRLLSSSLAHETPLGWSFAHEMVRDALVARAESHGRLASHHRACARMLLLREDSRRHAEEIGRHLRLGDRAEAAIPHLVVAIERRRRKAGDRAALPLLAELEAALGEAGIPPDERQWCELRVERAAVFNRLERTEDAQRWAREAETHAREQGWPELEARAMVELGRGHLTPREAPIADSYFARAEALLAEIDDPMLEGEVQAARARCARQLGDRGRARGHSVLAADYLKKVGERAGLASAWSVLGRDALEDDEHDRAEQYLQRALYLYERGGDTAGQADSWTWLGHVAWGRDELEEARKRLERALELYREAGSQRETRPQLALARVALAQRDWEAARAWASVILHRVEWTDQGPLQVATHAVLVASSAGSRNWRAFDLHLQRVREGVDRLGLHDADLVWCLTLASHRARAGRQEARAEQAAAVAEAAGAQG